MKNNNNNTLAVPINKYRKLASLICVPVVILSASLQASPVTPFNIANYNPLQQLYGFPRSHPPLLSDKKDYFSLQVDKVSYYTFDSSPNEQLEFDGESTFSTIVYNTRINNQYRWGITIPFVNISGGSLDSFIINWHDIFGLPQSGRDKAPRDVLRIYYQRGGSSILNLTESTSGVGDIALNLSKVLEAGHRNGTSISALSISLKLPTGESQDLHGSGAADVAAWWSFRSIPEPEKSAFNYFGSLGAMLLGKGDILPDQQRRIVGFGGAGIGYRLNQTIRFKVQADLHTPVYQDSGFSQLTGYVAQFTMGGEIAFSQDTKLDIGVAEDLYVDVSPDVVFHLNLSSRF